MKKKKPKFNIREEARSCLPELFAGIRDTAQQSKSMMARIEAFKLIAELAGVQQMDMSDDGEDFVDEEVAAVEVAKAKVNTKENIIPMERTG